MKNLDICMPNYSESIVNISNSFLKYFGIKPYHDTLPKLDKLLEKNYKNVVFIIFDGMGSFLMENHLPEDSIFRRNKIMNLTSVFPCTTATAITSMNSALMPIEHGWLAWQCYFKEYNRFIELFKNKDFYTSETVSETNVAETMLRYKSVVEIIQENNSDIKTKLIYPSFKKGGLDTVEEMFESMARTCKEGGKKFISIYWDSPDHIIHETGCFSEKTHHFINKINKYLEETSKVLKNTLIVITADHGLIDIDEYIELSKVPEINDCLIMPPSMEGRVSSFVVKYEKREQFKEAFNKLYGKDFKLFKKEEYIKQFLGEGKKHYKVDDFVGDFVSIAITQKSFKYTTENTKPSSPNVALHAGLTAQEMTVPLIAVEL